jgi:hypothetical protein
VRVKQTQTCQAVYCNITPGHIHIIIVAMEKQVLSIMKERVCVCVCVCSCLSYIACSSHIFCVVLYATCLAVWYFSTLSHKRHNFQKTLNIKYVFWFSEQLLSVNFVILRIQQDIIISLHRSCTRYCCLVLMKLWIVWQVFKKFPNIKFHDNLSGESLDVPWGQTDKMTWQA